VTFAYAAVVTLVYGLIWVGNQAAVRGELEPRLGDIEDQLRILKEDTQ